MKKLFFVLFLMASSVGFASQVDVKRSQQVHKVSKKNKKWKKGHKRSRATKGRDPSSKKEGGYTALQAILAGVGGVIFIAFIFWIVRNSGQGPDGGGDENSDGSPDEDPPPPEPTLQERFIAKIVTTNSDQKLKELNQFITNNVNATTINELETHVKSGGKPLLSSLISSGFINEIVILLNSDLLREKVLKEGTYSKGSLFYPRLQLVDVYLFYQPGVYNKLLERTKKGFKPVQPTDEKLKSNIKEDVAKRIKSQIKNYIEAIYTKGLKEMKEGKPRKDTEVLRYFFGEEGSATIETKTLINAINEKIKVKTHTNIGEAIAKVNWEEVEAEEEKDDEKGKDSQ